MRTKMTLQSKTTKQALEATAKQKAREAFEAKAVAVMLAAAKRRKAAGGLFRPPNIVEFKL